MTTYYRRPEMVVGGEFRCHNCHKLLIKSVKGDKYELRLECPRCNTTIDLRCKEPIPFVAEQLLKQEAING